MGSIVFTEEARHVSPELALQELISSFEGQKDFRMSGDPDQSGAEFLSLGSCVKSFEKYSPSDVRKREVKKWVDQCFPQTHEAQYVNSGQDGYLLIEAKIHKNAKRGKRYFVAEKSNSMFSSFTKIRSFESKTEAEKAAKEYAILKLSTNIYLINDKNEEIGHIYFSEKSYKQKPKLTEKSTRKLLPAYQYIFVGAVYVG